MDISLYTLIDPRDMSTFYVGKTRDIKKRYNEHIYSTKRSNIKTANKIRKILSTGQYPIIRHLTTVSENNWSELEMFLIEEYRSMGAKLTNISIGGESGAVGVPSPFRRPILQYTLTGKFIKEWESVAQIKMIYSGINYMLSGCGIKSQGYQWFYKDKVPSIIPDLVKEKKDSYRISKKVIN